MSQSIHVRLTTTAHGGLLPLLLCLASCTAKVDEPDEPLRGSACVEVCEGQHPEGLERFNKLSSECVCTRCTEACTSSVCGDKETPTDECLPCVQTALDGDDCHVHGGLFRANCLGPNNSTSSKDCAAFAECVIRCEPIPSSNTQR